MGEAKRRGSFEQRRNEAEKRDSGLSHFKRMFRQDDPQVTRKQAEEVRSLLSRYMGRVAAGTVGMVKKKVPRYQD